MKKALAALLCVGFPIALTAQQVPTPESVLGFRVGQDSMLASWRQIGEYFTRLAAASPKVRVDTLGPTTQGRPYLLVTISDPANLARRAELMANQRRLADPRGLSAADEARLVQAQPAVILINCSIHSTEIGASQMSMELAWRLATDSGFGAALRNVVVLLVPSANPDGIDIVGDWYRQSRWTTWDGTNPPWLYHPYVGHDDNRDWYMLTQPETRLLTRVLYRQWFPEVFYDIHQQGSTGSRMTLPPFSDPVNPNLDPTIVEGISLVGVTMAQALLDAGKTGAAHQERYDLWWHGGARSTPTRHNMIGLLTEAASARIATPLCLEPTQVRQPTRGVNYPAPWTPTCWHLRDIVDYELISSSALVTLASDQRAAFIQRFVDTGRRAALAGQSAPTAYILPADSGDAGTRALLGNLLIQAGVEVHRANAPLAVGGTTYAAGSLVIRMDQPFRAHAKDLLERQDYPDRRLYPGGPPAVPYDVAGWTLPLQMNVRAVAAQAPIDAAALERLDTVVVRPGTVSGRGDVALLANTSVAEITATWRALVAGGSVEIAADSFSSEGREWPAGTLIVRGARAAIERSARELGFDAVLARQAAAPAGSPRIAGTPRVGLYKSWNGSMDEGWTRWVFERLGVSYVTVTDSMVRQGGLREKYDVVVLPSETPAAITGGRRAGTAPPQYTGGLGREGTAALRAFLDEGGTVVALDEASRFAIDRLGAPARALRTTRGATTEGGEPTVRETQDTGSVFRFYAPGSIFETVVDRSDPIASGMGATAAVYFISSTILEAGPGARVVMSYPQGQSPLLSGYVYGAEALSGRAALIDAPVGRGRAILFGFRPQHRGQTYATFRLLTNAILVGASSAPARTGTPAGHTATGR
ncbi:MAG: M14 metallopeptidase family protein [Gemmatimonadales bacterium]